MAAACMLFACLMLLHETKNAKAQSKSNICRTLNAQLASLSRGGGGNASQYRKYQNAIRKQQIQLNKAQKASRRNGCVGVFKKRNSRCRQITSAIGKMQGNLSSLKRTQAQYAPSGSRNSSARAKIERRLRQNGCYGNTAENTQVAAANGRGEKKSRRRTLLEQVFGVRTYNNRGQREEYQPGLRDTIASRGGTYRTLCVRQSDGYYFPISFSTLPDRFDADEQTCYSMCPNHQVELYTHRMPQEDSEDMIAYRSEIPYSSQPFAFAYRRNHNPEIQCRFSVAGFSQSVDAATTGELEKPDSEKEKRAGTPVFRQDPADIPDAYDNKLFGMDWETAETYLEKALKPDEILADRDFNSGKKIRIVGPAFFPVQ